MAQQLPNNTEAEKALISYLVVRPEDVAVLDLRAEEFYNFVNRGVYSAIDRMVGSGKAVDFITLADELDKDADLRQANVRNYIMSAITDFVPGLDIRSSAEIIRDNYRRRTLVSIANDMAKSAFDTNQNVSDVTSRSIDSLSHINVADGGAVHWSHFIKQLLDDVEMRSKDPKDIWGIPTGFKDIDKATGGFQPSELVIISGKPGVGKSMLAMRMAELMSTTAPGAIYSLEMKATAVMRRILSANAKIPANLLKSGRLNDTDWDKIYEQVGKLEQLPIYMNDSSDYSTTKLRADLHRLKLQHNVQWFVFDYMMLAEDGLGLKETERTGMISRSFKQICRSLDMAGILIHSMNKEGVGNSQPDQENLRGSAQVSYDADLICFLTEFQAISSDDKYIRDTANLRTLFFAKGRELQQSNKYVHLVKHPNYPFFGDYVRTP